MLKEFIEEKLQQKKLLMMTHVICGYPSFEANYEALQVMQEAEVDLVELQFPFSEPSADGPLFVKANQLSLENGTTVDDCLEFMAKVSKNFSFKVLMMGYYNTAFTMGHETYISRLKKAGASGFILPDLPIEEAQELHSIASREGLDPILLMTPTNTDERLKQLAERASGFVYAVARKGVTGKKTEMGDQVAEFLKRCRKYTSVPLGVGFGISSKEDLDYLEGKGDIAIIGTAALRAWQAGGEKELRQFFKRLGKIS